MSSRSAPYATHDDGPVARTNNVVKKPVSTPPWEKDQSPKQSRLANARKAAPVKTTQTAPYGTAHNQPVLKPSPLSSSISKSAPYGTADNVPGFREVKDSGIKSPPYGTSADVIKSSKVPLVKPSAPWERNESRYTHKGKSYSNEGLCPPYATEPTK